MPGWNLRYGQDKQLFAEVLLALDKRNHFRRNYVEVPWFLSASTPPAALLRPLHVIATPAMDVGRERMFQIKKLIVTAQTKHGAVYCAEEDARLSECHAIKDGRSGKFVFAPLRPIASGDDPELPCTVAFCALG